MKTEEQEYKEKQKERIESYIVGSKDSTGNIITKIFSKGDEYLVYEIKTMELSDSIKVMIDTKIEDDHVPIDNFSVVREKFTKLKGLLYKVVDDTSIKARIGHILSHAITTNPTQANSFFDNLIEEINREYASQSRHRINYLLTTVIIMSIGICISIIVYSNSLYLNELLIRHFIFIATAASIGGFLSITRRLKQAVFEKDVKSYNYIFYATERMLIAIVAGIIVYFAIQSNLAFGIVKNLDKPIFGYLIFAVVAGFSETLIPNLLINLEKKEK